MKRTKSMIYRETVESRELTLFAENDSETYEYIKAVLRMIQKHYKKGMWEEEKAIDAFYPVACFASKRYAKIYCTRESDWKYIFNVTCRFTTATDLEADFRHRLKEEIN